MEKKLGISEARKQISEMVDDVQYGGDQYVIERNGQPAAAVVPIEVYEHWKRERKAMFDAIREMQAVNEGADPDQVMRDVLEAQQAVRRERGE